MANAKSGPSHAQAARRAEKLRVLSALLGPEVAARLRRDAEPPLVEAGELDAERAAWHRNRLLEKLRSRSAPGPAEPEARPARPAPAADAAADPAADSTARPGLREGSDRDMAERAGPRGGPSLDARLVSQLDPGRLGAEHPAVIARLLRSLERPARIETLKSLPGPVARIVVRRLREL